jgi:hypothetical protein
MPTFVLYDPSSLPVANRVTRVTVTNDHAMEDVANWLRNPVLPEGFTTSNSKVSDGEVVLMSAGELRSIVKLGLDRSRASRWSYKSPRSKLSETKFQDVL